MVKRDLRVLRVISKNIVMKEQPSDSALHWHKKSESRHKNRACPGWCGCNGICWVFVDTKSTGTPLNLLQPWQARFLCGDSDYFWYSVGKPSYYIPADNAQSKKLKSTKLCFFTRGVGSGNWWHGLRSGCPESVSSQSRKWSHIRRELRQSFQNESFSLSSFFPYPELSAIFSRSSANDASLKKAGKSAVRSGANCAPLQKKFHIKVH